MSSDAPQKNVTVVFYTLGPCVPNIYFCMKANSISLQIINSQHLHTLSSCMHNQETGKENHVKNIIIEMNGNLWLPEVIGNMQPNIYEIVVVLNMNN